MDFRVDLHIEFDSHIFMVQCEAIASLGLHMLRLASPGLRLRVVLRLASNRCRFSKKFVLKKFGGEASL